MTMIHVPLIFLFTEGPRTKEILDIYSTISQLLLSSPRSSPGTPDLQGLPALSPGASPSQAAPTCTDHSKANLATGWESALSRLAPQLRAEDCLCDECNLRNYQTMPLSSLGWCSPGSFCNIFQTTNVTIKNNLKVLLSQVSLRRRRSQKQKGLFPVAASHHLKTHLATCGQSPTSLSLFRAPHHQQTPMWCFYRCVFLSTAGGRCPRRPTWSPAPARLQRELRRKYQAGVSHLQAQRFAAMSALHLPQDHSETFHEFSILQAPLGFLG